MAEQSQSNLKSSTSKAHPFGVTVKAMDKGASTSTATSLRHASNVTSSFSNSHTHIWMSYGRDISIAVLFVISLTTLTVVIWHIIQTEGNVKRLQSKNDELREVIILLVVKTEQIENNDRNQDLLIATSINQTDVASTLAALADKVTELKHTDDTLLNDVTNVTKRFADVTETLTVLLNNITVLEASFEAVQNLTRNVEDADPGEKSTGPMILLPGDQETLFQVSRSGTYFFHVVAIVQSGLGSQLDFQLEIGSFHYSISSPIPGETVVRAYTRALIANDYVLIRNVGATESHIADIIINSHLINIFK